MPVAHSRYTALLVGRVYLGLLHEALTGTTVTVPLVSPVAGCDNAF